MYNIFGEQFFLIARSSYFLILYFRYVHLSIL